MWRALECKEYPEHRGMHRMLWSRPRTVEILRVMSRTMEPAEYAETIEHADLVESAGVYGNAWERTREDGRTLITWISWKARNYVEDT